MPPLQKAAEISDRSNDDYIAQLLTQDARSAPKPNTRFLQHILRETDTHNANLKRKEEYEAREKHRKLQRERKFSRESKHDTRERESKRRRVESSEDKERDRRKRRSDRSRDYSSEREESTSTSINHSTERNRKHNSDPRLRQESHRHRHHRRHEYDDKYERYDKRGKSKHSSDSRRSYEHKSSSKRRSDRQNHDNKTVKKDAPKSANSLDRQIAHDSDDSDVHTTRSIDSDPLSSLIGPQPPSKADARDPPTIPRGRGAYKVNTSNIDSHFAEEYDPSTDILPGEDNLNSGKNSRRPVAGLATEDDDWDMALEALRDRVAWKQRGAERLREAGFGDNVVERWENTKAFAGLDNCGGDGDMADVKWAKKGEGREWDRGKVVDEGGDISIKPMW
ncbi:hypothetical protein LOZ12_002263 [Ophidiomyces ophidiicola]|uniref:Uncharacterized protein n=1 Tax=Ophidiomyces ophidiicola TaxID=1387563 RepID=A0ACB8UYT5_9EURO|nr:hypothetical protein LOZ64_002039 [Ophidiomyces ophidiicola]KAI1950037.1 hypothetical protein LOZ62_002020 [Ophidiomyces ophidiicola]KAI1959434.1 hypothetical protein LOZ59_003037 [Ophidiomyces ophidiicola]KAI1973773.1 hypothetical protein LOZ56_001629 [Ophidiomyces ophidiicola]KAI2032287.1 hypothetical protein LOZ45_001158 [Ophidiomyces ophidiicola]